VLPERLRSLFRRENSPPPLAGQSVPQRDGGVPAAPGRSQPKVAAPSIRHSRGLEQFFLNIRDVVGLSILDMAGLNQENVNVLSALGHKLYASDLVRSIDDTFGYDLAEQNNASRLEYFLQANFNYLPDTFDGVILWDALQFMTPAVLAATVDRLHMIMRPGGYLLAYFSAQERLSEVPSHTFRFVDDKSILVTERGLRAPGQVFNNRNLEKTFARFDSVKFFLTRENLREVIVRR